LLLRNWTLNNLNEVLTKMYNCITGFQDTMIDDWNISPEEIKKIGKMDYRTDHLSINEKGYVVRKIANKRIKEKLTQITLAKITIGVLFALMMYFFLSPYQIMPALIFFILGYLLGILIVEPGWYGHRKDMFRQIGKEGNDYVDVYYWGSSI